MLVELWPQYGLTISTPRLELRLPREEELAELAHLAGKGVHRRRAPGLGVFRRRDPLGMVTLRARDFLVVGEVMTSAWLGIEHQGKGYGTEARSGLLTLAFDHLGANAALSEVFQDNHSSQGVSRKLGYEHDGVSVDARGDEAVVSDRLRLTREKWTQQTRHTVTVDGMAACRPMFGL